MKEVNEILKKYNIHGIKYKKLGKCIVIDDRYVIKPNKTNIYDYLNYRNFNNYPEITIEDSYEISDYLNEVEIPNEQKMIDLITIVSNLHKKTTYYKKISEFNVEEIYTDIKNKLDSIKLYYDDLMNIVESTIYMPPSYYLLARNISFVYKMIEYSYNSLNKWKNNIEKIDKIRVSIIHNNLKLEHLINNKLISWDNSKIGLPIFDLYKLYTNTYNEYDWNELLNIYFKNYPLKNEELLLFKILISIPLKLNLTNIEIDNVEEINNKLDYLKLTYDFIFKEIDEINKKSEI